MDNEKIPIPKFKASDLVIDAIKNAELVLYYCAEAGIDVNVKDVEVITDAKRIFSEDNWNRDIEISFWMAYRNLTTLIKPVSVDSLKAAQETAIKNPNFLQRLFNRKNRATLAYRVVRFYTIFAVATMIIMLVMHIYFSIGTVRLNRIKSASEQIVDLESQLDEMELISDNTNLSAQQKQDRLINQLFEVNTEKESNIKLLEEWVGVIQNIIVFDKNDEVSETETSDGAIDDVYAGPTAPEETLDSNIQVIQQAQNYVLVIGLYILPLFYGLLGALTFVLRDLSNQTNNMKYTKESNITHILRLILGTIAGLAVGVFWGDLKQQESFIIIRSLGPLIVAYLAGLTVEYIFSAIEKWISSILDKALSKKN